MEFNALPHKIFQAEQFSAAVDRLRERFLSKEILRPEYRKNVPADGLAAYAESLWQAIIACRDVVRFVRPCPRVRASMMRWSDTEVFVV